MAKDSDKRLGFWRSLVPYGHFIDCQKIKEGFKKRTWLVLRIFIPILIVASGATFVIFAVIYKLIDADSARYLLSAIVQALAALLAIIFAGVAILWSNEAREIQHLDSHRKEIETILFGPQDWKDDDPKEWPLTLVQKELSQKWNQKKIPEYVKTGFTNIVRLFRMRSSQNPYIERKKKKIWKELEVTFIKPFHIPYEEIRGWEQTEVLRKSGVEFFEAAIPVSDLYKAYGEKRYKYYGTLFGVAREIINLHVRDSLGVIHRARRARRGWFKFLIFLYSITIAVGMVFLSVLKRGTCDIQA
ncbi:hypothetical protein ES703_68168 [subsurface metagenome]